VTPHGYPLSLNLDGRKCVVVGGGPEALMRARNLLDAGALVWVIAEQEPPGMDALSCPHLRVERRAFTASDVDEAWLVVLVTQDAALASELKGLCDCARIFFCAVDQPEYSSYSHLALARAGSLTLAVSTEGRAPALGRRLREELARMLVESSAAEELERLARLRDATPSAQRREVLSRAVADVHFTGTLRFRKP
jgi:siroheme synthase-like protein